MFLMSEGKEKQQCSMSFEQDYNKSKEDNIS